MKQRDMYFLKTVKKGGAMSSQDLAVYSDIKPHMLTALGWRMSLEIESSEVIKNTEFYKDYNEFKW